MAATMEQGSDGEVFANFEDSFERGNHLPDVLLDADVESIGLRRFRSSHLEHVDT